MTEVSGDRSSWATVEISAALSASARRRASASRITTMTRLTGWLRPGRRYFAVTSTSRPVGDDQQLLAVAGADAQPAPRVGDVPPGRAVAVLQRQRLADVGADELCAPTSEDLARPAR